MSEISIGPVTTTGPTIRCPIEYDRPLRRFFTGEAFVADYDVAVEDVPESVAVVPVLAHVCPVAWANGADVRAPAVDAEFLASLRDVGRELVEMYPAFMRGGRIRVGEAVENEGAPGREDGRDDAAMLFSGGVDSVATYLRHREEEPALVSVQGWVVGRNQPERWSRVRRQVERFADVRGVDSHAISSNMLECLDTPMLQAHYKRHVDGAWYSSVGHGLGLLGLCAPLAYASGYGTLYMAATHTEAFAEPWGSHPRIDDRVRWSGTRAVHDGYELSRQEKIELIADYVRAGNEELTLRTCIHSEAGENCDSCEKCYRTAVGLVLAGLDPNEFGYDVDGSTFEEIRRAFERGSFALGEDQRFMWRDIQEHVRAARGGTNGTVEKGEGGASEERSGEAGAGEDQSGEAGAGVDAEKDAGGTQHRDLWPEAEAFFTWLRTADVDALVDRSEPPFLDRVVRAGMRHAPYPVYAAVYSVYDQVRTATGRR